MALAPVAAAGVEAVAVEEGAAAEIGGGGTGASSGRGGRGTPDAGGRSSKTGAAFKRSTDTVQGLSARRRVKVLGVLAKILNGPS